MPVDDDVSLRTRMSQLTGLSVVAMVMLGRREDAEILRLAVTSLTSLGRSRVVATSMASDGSMLRGADGKPLAGDDIGGQLIALDGADGPVSSRVAHWVWAFALRSIGGYAGYVVVGADAEPPEIDLFLLRMLALQTGVALTSAALHRRERETAAELRRVNSELTFVNEQLGASVVDLERHRRIHEVLTAVSASGGGERGIAAAVHDLTGLPVTVEDGFGNLRIWAGPGEPPTPRHSVSHRREEVLAKARQAGRPMRDRGRVIALAQPRNEVLGVLALVDPERRAGKHELVALEEGAVVLAMELAHQRALAETELRLRRDLVDDLLSGTDDASALPRAAVLGHDLSGPHQVLLVRWPGESRDDAVEQALDRALAAVLQTRALLARRPGGVVAIVPQPTGPPATPRWGEVYKAVGERLRNPNGAIGIGGVVMSASQVPRSYRDAERALRIRQGSTVPAGVTAYDELGVYRLLASADSVEAEHFVREWLGTLLDYDAAKQTELVLTLWRYYECGGNYDCAAQALHIHRSTLRYRLRRIRQLTGHDLNAVDSKLNLHVATRAWHIMLGSS